jgi:Spy/CpxP family protein refolding chaperone
MIPLRWMFASLPVVLALAAGCGGGGTPQAASPAGSADVAPAGSIPLDEDDESTVELKEHHRHHHHGGFAMFVAMSLDSLGTTPEQNAAITKIQTDLHAKMQPAHDAEKNVLLVLADGVATGTIDKAKVDAAVAQVSSAAAGVHDAVADSMNQLYQTLTPPQRIALVDKLEAHYKVWHKANEEGAGEPGGHGGPFGALAKDLSLTADQVDKARAALGTPSTHYDAAEGEAHLKAFGSAFEGSSFDAKTLTTGGPANAHMASFGVTRMVRLYEALTPVLTADQRTKLADMLRKHANYKRTASGT